MNITVNGQQYVWRFQYPGRGQACLRLQRHGRPGRHDRHARHHSRRRRRTPGGSRSSAARWTRPGLHEQDLVPDPARRDPGGSEAGRLQRASAPSCAAATTPNMYGRVIGMRYDDYKALVRRKGRSSSSTAQDRRRASSRSAQQDSSTAGARTRPTQHDRPIARPRPQIIAHERRRAERARLDLVAHHHRSQEDRDHVPLHGPRLLRAGRRRGAADAHPARRSPDNTLLDARAVQPDPHACTGRR